MSVYFSWLQFTHFQSVTEAPVGKKILPVFLVSSSEEPWWDRALSAPGGRPRGWCRSHMLRESRDYCTNSFCMKGILRQTNSASALFPKHYFLFNPTPGRTKTTERPYLWKKSGWGMSCRVILFRRYMTCSRTVSAGRFSMFFESFPMMNICSTLGSLCTLATFTMSYNHNWEFKKIGSFWFKQRKGSKTSIWNGCRLNHPVSLRDISR